MHFTYRRPDADNPQLKQGDVLEKTAPLRRVLREVHPHYLEEQYRYFQVVTQTCDLVRRGDNNVCNSRYITLAAVRSFEDVVERLVYTHLPRRVKIEETIYASKEDLGSLRFQIKRLINNNYPNFFFLEAEPEVDFPVRCCTLLQLSISIRAYEHYEACLGSKILELEEPFDAKLGWMVGNLYSRVGTTDYKDGVGISEGKLTKDIDGALNRYVGWIDKSKFPDFEKAAEAAATYAEADRLKERKQEEREQEVVSQLVNKVSASLASELSEDEKRKLRNALAQTDAVKRAAS